jgi:aldehyde dehydrogenase (NAD+)
METTLVVPETDVLARQLHTIFEQQLAHTAVVRKTTAAQRKEKLRHLRRWMTDNQAAIHEALRLDFGKSETETDISEIYNTQIEIDHAVRHLSRWMRPKRVGTPLVLIGTQSQVIYEPKGVALIISPWNYPFYLLVGPLVSAIAAGCCVVLKPSEMTPHTSALAKRMAAELFDPQEITVVEGDASVATALLKLPFHHIFFTGSPQVGKIVMRAAAENLASVTLELGGKSPCIVDETAAIADAAEKITIGKFLNAGQTCIAPDYVLVHESRQAELVQAIRQVIERFYGNNPEQSPDLARIINAKHLNRLRNMVSDAVAKGATVVTGGIANEATNYLSPILLTQVTPDMQVMKEEIFGPVLPILTYRDHNEAIRFVNERDKPLALYMFSRDQSTIDSVLGQTSAGGVSVNECLMHILQPNLPFGGVNNSGVGKAHGFYGFTAFSNEKGVLRQRIGLTNYKALYPPYTPTVKRLTQLLLRWL